MIHFIDLFAGIGGLRLGATQAFKAHGIDAKCVLSSEINDKACETYELNFGEYPQGDIHGIEEIKPFDFLLGGFPCQPFSYAGKRLGFGDTRGTLFFEIERILDKYKPKAFLLENVRGLYTHDRGRTFETIMQKLHDLGYGTYDMLLNSSNFGVPQNRVRLYIVGILGETPMMSLHTDLGAVDSHAFKKKSKELGLFDEVRNNWKIVGDILEPSVDAKYVCSDTFQQQLQKVIGQDLSKLHGYRLIDYRGGQAIHSWQLGKKGECTEHEIELLNLMVTHRRHPEFGKDKDGKRLTLEQIKTFYKRDDIAEIILSLLKKGYMQEKDGRYNLVCGNMSFEVFKFLDPNSISVTLTSSDSNRLGVVQGNVARRITPRECARLQGFPDSFVVNPSDAYAYKQFGNSVSVPVIEAIIDDFLNQNRKALGWEESRHAVGVKKWA